MRSCLRSHLQDYGRQLYRTLTISCPSSSAASYRASCLMAGQAPLDSLNFTDAIKDFSYWKDRVDAIDEESLVFKYSVIEGGLIGKKVKSTSFELKFEARKDGGSICKLNGEYETTEDSRPTEGETKEMMGSMVSMFKSIEGYLVANPAAYA